MGSVGSEVMMCFGLYSLHQFKEEVGDEDQERMVGVACFTRELP